MRMFESNSVFYLLSTFSQTEFKKMLLQKSEFCGVDDVHDLNTIRYLVLRDNAPKCKQWTYRENPKS